MNDPLRWPILALARSIELIPYFQFIIETNFSPRFNGGFSDCLLCSLYLSTEMEISMPWTCLQVLGKDEEGCEGSYNRIESRQAKLPMMPIAF